MLLSTEGSESGISSGEPANMQNGKVRTYDKQAISVVWLSEGKFVPVYAMKACRDSRYIICCFLTLALGGGD